MTTDDNAYRGTAERVEAELAAVAAREPIVGAWVARLSDEEVRTAFAAAQIGRAHV